MKKKTMIQKVNEAKKQHAKWAAKPVTRGDVMNLCIRGLGFSLALCATGLVVYRGIEMNNEWRERVAAVRVHREVVRLHKLKSVSNCDDEAEDQVDG